jgi:hypothetical protein
MGLDRRAWRKEAPAMKQQVARLSPHQNGKVFGVLAGVSSLVFLVPFVLFFSAFGPRGGPPTVMFLLMPLFYLVFGYVSVAVGCVIYNFLVRYTGGVEFETRDVAG